MACTHDVQRSMVVIDADVGRGRSLVEGRSETDSGTQYSVPGFQTDPLFVIPSTLRTGGKQRENTIILRESHGHGLSDFLHVLHANLRETRRQNCHVHT